MEALQRNTTFALLAIQVTCHQSVRSLVCSPGACLKDVCVCKSFPSGYESVEEDRVRQDIYKVQSYPILQYPSYLGHTIFDDSCDATRTRALQCMGDGMSGFGEVSNRTVCTIEVVRSAVSFWTGG